jgi:hypothetical protein
MRDENNTDSLLHARFLNNPLNGRGDIQKFRFGRRFYVNPLDHPGVNSLFQKTPAARCLYPISMIILFSRFPHPVKRFY